MNNPSAGRFLAAADDANVRAFRGLVDRFLEETHERFPESASRLGLDGFNSRLDEIQASKASQTLLGWLFKTAVKKKQS